MGKGSPKAPERRSMSETSSSRYSKHRRTNHASGPVEESRKASGSPSFDKVDERERSRSYRSRSRSPRSNRKGGYRDYRSRSRSSNRRSRGRSMGERRRSNSSIRHSNQKSWRSRQDCQSSSRSYRDDRAALNPRGSAGRSSSSRRKEKGSLQMRHQEAVQQSAKHAGVLAEDKVKTKKGFEKLNRSPHRNHATYTSQSPLTVAGSSTGLSSSPPQEKFKIDEGDLAQFKKILFEPPTLRTTFAQVKHLQEQITINMLTELVRAIFKTFYSKRFGLDPNSPDGICVKTLKAYVATGGEKGKNRRWLGLKEEEKLTNGGLRLLDISALRILIQRMLGSHHPAVQLVSQLCERRNAICHDIPATGHACVTPATPKDDNWVARFLNQFQRIFHTEKSLLEEIPRRLDAHKEFPYIYISYREKLVFSISFLLKGKLDVANELIYFVFEEMNKIKNFNFASLFKLKLFFNLLVASSIDVINAERVVGIGSNFARSLVCVAELLVDDEDELGRLLSLDCKNNLDSEGLIQDEISYIMRLYSLFVNTCACVNKLLRATDNICTILDQYRTQLILSKNDPSFAPYIDFASLTKNFDLFIQLVDENGDELTKFQGELPGPNPYLTVNYVIAVKLFEISRSYVKFVPEYRQWIKRVRGPEHCIIEFEALELIKMRFQF